MTVREVSVETVLKVDLVERPGAYKPLEEVVDRLLERVDRLEINDYSAKMLSQEYSECMERGNILHCMYFIDRLWGLYTDRILDFRIVTVTVRRVCNNIMHVVVFDIEEDYPILDTYIEAQQATDRDIVEWVRQKLQDMYRNRYYTLDELRQLVQKLHEKLREKVKS